ncbi:hypothetical protein B296_00021988 [Ensete ventricosum]|uniref:Uncharacterized protein n=1 Tax=Ensete ventricosum TaxID=4639 RepID=A0A427AAH6_ENSVE|nr:hypothetical protein B296_00021988 [Ensete ventricosum]
MMMQAITFHRSKHVAIRDLTVLNGQQMHIAFTSCSHVRASRLKVTSPAESPNTDGIHISGSIATLVEDSTIRTGPSGLVNPPSCLASAVVGLIKRNVGSSKEVDVVV